MRFSKSLAFLSLSGLGLASPVDQATALETRHTTCLNDKSAGNLIEVYRRIISKWEEKDAKYLAPDFRDTSDSINILAGIPLGSNTFNRASFLEHMRTQVRCFSLPSLQFCQPLPHSQLTPNQPDNLPLEITHKMPHNCNEVAFIWRAKFGAAQKYVRGLTILGASWTWDNGGYWQIKSFDVEFNSIAYLQNIGGSITMPSY